MIKSEKCSCFLSLGLQQTNPHPHPHVLKVGRTELFFVLLTAYKNVKVLKQTA